MGFINDEFIKDRLRLIIFAIGFPGRLIAGWLVSVYDQ